MSKILAGYRVTVESWENDADNYRTKIKEGLTQQQVTFVVEVLSHMKSSSNGGKERGMWGNMYDPKQDDRDAFGAFFFEIVQRHAPVSYELMGWEDEDIEAFKDGDDDLPYVMLEFITEFTGSSEFFTRVVSKIVVELIPMDIEIEDVTNQFVKK